MTGGSFLKANFASPAGSGWRTPLLARGVLAAGDAAIAFHPQAWRGIFSALTTGLGAAGAVIAAAGDDGAIDGAVAEVEHAAIEYRSGYRETDRPNAALQTYRSGLAPSLRCLPADANGTTERRADR